jgi:hypothetical protein
MLLFFLRCNRRLVGARPSADNPAKTMGLPSNVCTDATKVRTARAHPKFTDGRVHKENDDLMSTTRYAMMMLRYARTDIPAKPRSIRSGRGGWMAA